jgi:uncharacterized repeat protein (TIGR01451 family)
MRPARWITVLSLFVAIGAFAPAASGSLPQSPEVTATISDAPDPVTAGEQVRYTTTLENQGPATITHVELSLPLPAGMTADSATPSAGSCQISAGEVDCQIGTISAGGSASVAVLATTPSTAGSVEVTATWLADIGQNQPHQFFASETTDVAARTQDLVSGYVPPGGETLTTDLGSGATPGNPQVTTANIPRTPDGTPATLAEQNASGPGDACAPGKTCFGQISDITIGAVFSSSDPLQFTFRFDRSEIPKGLTLKKTPLYHDGVLVPNCSGAAGLASPDPCVASRAKLADGDYQLVALSSTNGRWRP